MNENHVKEIARKWYQILDFPEEFDSMFFELLESENGFYPIAFSDFDAEKHENEYQKNVIWALYFCEEISLRFKEKGISDEIMMDTLSDVRFVIMKYTEIFGEMSLKGISTWVNLHLSFKLFKIGRLQYEIRGAEKGAEHLGLPEGAPVLAVHIPRDERLSIEAAEDSLKKAVKFFEYTFPEYDFNFFTCHSWLLDENLKRFLPEDSNIIKFQNLFTYAKDDLLDSAIAFCFPYGVTRENISSFNPNTSLQAKIKEHVLNGGALYYTFGLIKREKYQ